MINIKTYIVGYIETNMYLVMTGERKNRLGVVIDPGFTEQESGKIIKELQRYVGEIPAIMITHGHFDHTSGLHILKDNFKSKVYCHELDRDKLIDPLQSGAALFGFKGDSVEPDVLLRGGEMLELGDMACRVIHTPGHSQGSISVLFDNKHLFSGDLIFRGGIGRTDFPDSDYDLEITSIRKILRLPGEVTIYPGHGPTTTVKEESANFV